MSTIYHCEISVYADDNNYNEAGYIGTSEVFATLEDARAWGIKEIDDRVQKLVDKIIPKNYKGKEVDEWINEWNINFNIIEFDPARKKEINEMTEHILAQKKGRAKSQASSISIFDFLDILEQQKNGVEKQNKKRRVKQSKKYDGDARYDALYKDYHYKNGSPMPPYLRTDPYQVVWYFDRHGNFIDRYYWLDECFVYRYLPGDDDPKAGTKFKTGDYVIYTEDKSKKGEVYVVSSTPYPVRFMRWTNRYDLWGVKNGEFIPFVDSGPGFGVHETDLKLYKGKISEDNPLHFLRLIAIDEIKLTDKEWDDLYKGKIVLNEKPSWQEIIAEIGGAK